MGTKDLEVEIKIKLNKTDLERVRKRLKETTKFVDSTQEIDKYFNAPHKDFLKPALPRQYLRIRYRKNAGFITYKYDYFNKDGEKTHNDEYESAIESPEAVEKILRAVDFKNFVIIDKQRERYQYKKSFDVALDEVKKLGYFIEIESLKDFGGIRKTRRKLFAFAQSVGIDPSLREKKSYVYMMLKKMGLK